MSNKITKEDLFGGDLFGDYNNDATIAIKKTQQLIAGFKEMALIIKRDLNNLDFIDPSAEKKMKDLEIQQKTIEKLQKEIEIRDAKIQKIRDQQLKQAKRQADEQKKLNSAYAQASARLNDLRKRYKDLAVAGRDNGKVARALKQEIDQLDKTLKKVDASVGQFQRHVGDYKNQVKEALNETELFNGGLDKLGAQGGAIISGLRRIVLQFKNMQKAQDDAAAGTSKLGKGLKAAGIGLIIAALTSLYSAFTTTRKGALQFELLMGRLGNALTVVASGLANVGRGLIGFGKGIKQLFTGDFSDAGKSFSESFDKIVNSFDGFGDKLKATDPLIREIIKAEFEWADTQRTLNRELQETNLNLEDFQEISADTTRSFEERNAALQQSFILERQSANIQKQLADTELKYINDRIRLSLKREGIRQELSDKEIEDIIKNQNLRLLVSEEDLQKQQELLLKRNEIADKIDDLDRQQGQRKRQRLEEELKLELDLLRGKRLNANSEADILKQQLDNERNTLRERQRLLNELSRVNRETYNEQVRLIQEVVDKEAKSLNKKSTVLNAENLLRIKNNIELEKYLKSLNISTNLIQDIAEVVKKQQDAELEGSKEQNKINEDSIKLKQRLLQLEQERQQLLVEGNVDDIQNILSSTEKDIEETQANILKNENAFNRELINKRLEAHEKMLELIRQEYEQRSRLIELQREQELKEVDNSVIEEEEKIAKNKNINLKYDNEQDKLRGEKINKEREANKKEKDDLEAIKKQQISIIVDYVDKSLDAISNSIEKRSQREQEALDKREEENDKELDRQRSRAERNLDNQLAFEEQNQAQLELVKEQQKQKEKNRELLLGFLKSWASYAEQDPNTALAKAFKDLAIAKTADVLFAATGAENIKGPGTETSDSIPAMLSLHESVVTARGTKDNPGLATAMNDGRVPEYFAENMDKYLPYMHLPSSTGSTAENFYSSATLNQLVSMNNRLASLEKTVANKKETTVELTKLGEIIVTNKEQGNIIRTLYKNRRPRI